MKPATPSVYLIKPKYIFKTPFLKYDLQNPTNRQAQNQQLTQYFNYGFNEDTMNIYVKLVNRMLKVLDHKKNLQYFDEPSELMRLNDQIPMDLGGFCKFYDPQLFKNDYIQNDEELLKNFLFNIVKASWINGKQLPTYPMLEFVKSMYPPKPTDKEGEQQQQNSLDFEDNPLPLMIEQISQNLEKKYQQTMTKLIEQKNQPKQPHPSSLPFKKTNKFERKPRFPYQQRNQEKPEQRRSYKQRQRESSYKQRQKQSYKERESYKERQKSKEKEREREREKEKERERQKERQKEKQKEREKHREKKRKESSSSSSSSQSSSGTSSNSSSESQEKDRRRKRRKEGRRDDRRQSSRRKDKRPGQRDRKTTKQRTQSRHGSSRYDDRERDRNSKRRSRSRDHKRSRR